MELLRLLVEFDTPDPSLSDKTITIDNRHWKLTDFPTSGTIPAYACISYVWGRGRSDNPLNPAIPISDQTLPSFSAAVRFDPTGTLKFKRSAYWIDVFCVPAEQPYKRITLESLGYIFRNAEEVIVALSSSVGHVMTAMERSDGLTDDELEVLERDEWVKSVWTYQEVVCSKDFYLRSTSVDASTIVKGPQFGSDLGFSLMKYQRRYALDDLAIRERFPVLDALIDIVGDWHVMGDIATALQAMSNLDRRTVYEKENYFYSLIGAITEVPSTRPAARNLSQLWLTFMKICEQKNDYSFIYSATPRDPVRPWRPAPSESLPRSILPWHSWGEGQKAHIDDDGSLWLDHMMCLDISQEVGEPAQDWFNSHPVFPGAGDQTTVEKIFRFLQRIGFTGSNKCIITSLGWFFPQEELVLEATSSVKILVGLGTRFAFGAAGLAQVFTKGSAGTPQMWTTAGVFVGIVQEDLARSVLLEGAVTDA